MDVETGEHRGDAPARLVHAQQFGDGLAEGVVSVVGAGERDLRHGVAQHPGSDRMSLMHVCGVARKQHTSLAVARRLPGHVGETGDPRRAVHPEVRPVDDDESLAEIVQGGFTGVFVVLFGQYDPYRPSILHPVEGSLMSNGIPAKLWTCIACPSARNRSAMPR